MSAPAAIAAEPSGGAAADVAVLIVDDNASKRLALRAVLTPLEHEIVEADSGRAALRCVMAQDFAVILLDIRMPEMNGFETASVIRKRQQSELTPIIFITAYANDELGPLDRYAEGAVDFMMAPVRPEELRAKVTVFAQLFLQNQALAAHSRDFESESDHWKLLVDHIPVGVFQTDLAHHIVYTNARWSEMTGIRPGDAEGRTVESLLGVDAAGLALASAAYRFELHPPGMAPRLVEMTSAALPTGVNHPSGWVSTLSVVGDDPRAARTAETDADARTNRDAAFADLVAAELRVPMRSIIELAQEVLEHVDTWEPAEPAGGPGTIDG